MSFKDLFIIWGQSTKQRTTDALQRADMEMQQRNMGITERRKELLKLIELENKRLNGLRSNLGKIKREYKKEGGGTAEWLSMMNAWTRQAAVRQQYSNTQVDAFLELQEKKFKDWERTQEMKSALTGYSREAKDLASAAVETIHNKDTLKEWLTSTLKISSDALTKAVNDNQPAGANLIYDIAYDIYDTLESTAPADSKFTNSNLTVLDIANILKKQAGVDKVLSKREADAERDKLLKEEWAKSKANKDMPTDIGINMGKLQARINKGIADKPKFKTFMKDSGFDIKEIAGAKAKLKKYEEQLEKSPFPSYDYGDVQKRAGEILISQDVAEKIKSMTPEDVAYFKSMPGALKYADKEDISKIGKMGDIVQKLMALEVQKEPPKRSSYGALLEKIKGSVETEEEGSLAASLITSRILRAAKSAMDAEDAKEKAAELSLIGTEGFRL